jgi:transposase
MDIIHDRCAGLDVHKASILACALLIVEGEVIRHSRRFGTTTAELLALADWLAALGVTHVAMESTGVY